MAKLQTSGIVQSITGKLNGSVFQRFGSVVLMRNNKQWNKLQSVSFQNQKKRVAFLSAGWRELSGVERTAWESITGDYPRTDNFGNTYYLTGYQLYMSLNLPLLSNDIGTISAPVAPAVISNIGDFSANAGGATDIKAVWTDAQSADEYVQIFASHGASKGKGLQGRAFCFMASQTNNAVQNLTVTSEWENRFGQQISGQRVYLKAVVLNVVTGQEGVPSYTYMDIA